MKSWRHLPLAPLLARIPEQKVERDGAGMAFRRGQAELARRIGVDRKAVSRWSKDGLNEWQADRAAFALGLHPSEVWGPLWRWVALEPEHESRGRFCFRVPLDGGAPHVCALDGCSCKGVTPSRHTGHQPYREVA